MEIAMDQTDSQIRIHRSVSVTSTDMLEEVRALSSASISETIVESGSIKKPRRALSLNKSTRPGSLTGQKTAASSTSNIVGIDRDGASSCQGQHQPGFSEAKLRLLVKQQRESQILRELAEFLRSKTPPPNNYMSVPDEYNDAASVASSASRSSVLSGKSKRWSQLKSVFLRRKSSKKRKQRRHRSKSQIQLPDSAVAGTTIEGHRHIAISIPVEYSHLGPEVRSQYPVYGPEDTPDSPPAASEIETQQGPVRPWMMERGMVTVLNSVAEVGESVENLSQANQLPTSTQAPPIHPTASTSVATPSSMYSTRLVVPSGTPPVEATAIGILGDGGEVEPDIDGRTSGLSVEPPPTSATTLNEYFTTPNSPKSAPVSPSGDYFPSRHSSNRLSNNRSSLRGSNEPDSIDGIVSRQSRILEPLSHHTTNSSTTTNPDAFVATAEEGGHDNRYSVISHQSIADSIVTNGTEPVIVTEVQTVRRISSTASFVQRHSMVPINPLWDHDAPSTLDLSPRCVGSFPSDDELSTVPARCLEMHDNNRGSNGCRLAPDLEPENEDAYHREIEIYTPARSERGINNAPRAKLRRPTSGEVKLLSPALTEDHAPSSPVSQRTIRPTKKGAGCSQNLLPPIPTTPARGHEAATNVSRESPIPMTTTSIVAVDDAEPSTPLKRPEKEKLKGLHIQGLVTARLKTSHSHKEFQLQAAPRFLRQGSPSQTHQRHSDDLDGGRQGSLHYTDACPPSPPLPALTTSITPPTPPGDGPTPPRSLEPPPPPPKDTKYLAGVRRRSVPPNAHSAAHNSDSPNGHHPSRPPMVPLDRISISRRIERRKQFAAAAAEAQQARIFAAVAANAEKEKQRRQEEQRQQQMQRQEKQQQQKQQQHSHEERPSSSSSFDHQREKRVEDMERRVKILERSGEVWLGALVPLLDSLNRTLAEQRAEQESLRRQSDDAMRFEEGFGGCIRRNEDGHMGGHGHDYDEDDDSNVVFSLRNRIPSAPRLYRFIADDDLPETYGLDAQQEERGTDRDSSWKRQHWRGMSSLGGTTAATNHSTRDLNAYSSTTANKRSANAPKRASTLLREFEEEVSRRRRAESLKRQTHGRQQGGEATAGEEEEESHSRLPSRGGTLRSSAGHSFASSSFRRHRRGASSSSSYATTAAHGRGGRGASAFYPEVDGPDEDIPGYEDYHYESHGAAVPGSRGGSNGDMVVGNHKCHPDGFQTLAPLMNEIMGTARVSMEFRQTLEESLRGDGESQDEDDLFSYF